ncbi:hypothetical protein [Streptomyces sp. ISL-12]|uniref:hypothetical protein n=1 Tax=Streptomyces sp. ISL-12 TaxID=2819177 RepID=UPI002034E8ED|nr:hypothetical protein [Streptomyces sp. ISL-12]
MDDGCLLLWRERCEMIGFVLSGQGLPALYVSGDNASIRTVAEISRRVAHIDAAVLQAGTARVPAKFDGRPLSLDSRRAATAAAVLGADIVLSARYDGWTYFSEGPAELELALYEAALAPLLHAVPHGHHGGPTPLPHAPDGQPLPHYQPAQDT